MFKRIVAAFLPLLLLSASHAQSADPQLLAEIQKIKAIDNHSHPPKVVAPGEKDDDFDALPCDPLEPSMPTLKAIVSAALAEDIGRGFDRSERGFRRCHGDLPAAGLGPLILLNMCALRVKSIPLAVHGVFG